MMLRTQDASKELEQKRLILQRLAESCGRHQEPKALFWRNIKLRFAVIDSRRHSYLRAVCLRWSGAWFVNTQGSMRIGTIWISMIFQLRRI
mmetsp:Transcript_26950/g.50842  ORF Transcript_26950/g.50842 Transcript_26950/m.50842 type:complete len:91 (+) Transcript_26950:397-669(+)